MVSTARNLAILVAFGLLLAPQAEAQNLIRNPGFRTDLIFWTVPSDPNVTTQWEAADSQAAPGSGSVAVINQADDFNIQVRGLSQCLDVSSLQEFEFSGNLLMAGGQSTTGSAIVSLSWFDQGGCNSLLAEQDVLTLPGPSGWVGMEASGVIPEGAVSVQVNLDLLKNQDVDELKASFDNLTFRPLRTGACGSSETDLCLNNGRFKVSATFRTATGDQGQGQAVPLTDDTGYFWFFNSANVEMVVKVLNNCNGASNRYWVFAGGLTNVEVELVVEDTLFPGVSKTYTNPLETPFEPIQDTGAFATCP